MSMSKDYFGEVNPLLQREVKIVKEQAAMLGFGNMGGLSLGISKPTDKYLELEEDAQDSNTSDTINVNYMNQQAANQNMEDWEMGEVLTAKIANRRRPNGLCRVKSSRRANP